MNLAVITPYYNPCGYQRLLANYHEYVDQFVGWGLRSSLFTIELVLDDDPGVIADLTYYGNRPTHCLWQKESMINSTMLQLPSQYDAVAWIDADILFPDDRWFDLTKQALEKHKLVQMFDYADLLGPDRKPVLHRRSTVACKQTGTNSQGAWGMAWAARRESVKSLPWFFVAGGGDVHAAKAMMGQRVKDFGYAYNLTREYHTWADQQGVKSLKDISYLPIRIQHLYHGTRENRRYMYRDTLLQRHRFDPNKDVVRDAKNAFATNSWADPDSTIAREIRAWFSKRQEDA